MTDAREMQQSIQDKHQEVLEMIAGLSSAASSDRESYVCKPYYFPGT